MSEVRRARTLIMIMFNLVVTTSHPHRTRLFLLIRQNLQQSFVIASVRSKLQTGSNETDTYSNTN